MEASSETGTKSGLQVVSEMVGAKVVPVESKMVEAKAVASELEMSGVKSEVYNIIEVKVVSKSEMSSVVPESMSLNMV